MRYTYNKLGNVIWESKYIVVLFEEHDKIDDGIPLWIPVLVESLALM